MNHKPQPPDDAWETDAVWKLLDQAPPRSAGPRFAADTVRAARNLASSRSWWQRFGAPSALAGLSAAAAITLAVIFLNPPVTNTSVTHLASNDEAFADIQKIAEVEVLSAAVDNIDDFTDTELVSMIGF